MAYPKHETLPETAEAWQEVDFGQYSDRDLRIGLQEAFGVKSEAYFLRRDEKIQFMTTEAVRPRLLERAVQKRDGSRNTSGQTFVERIAEQAGDTPWTFVANHKGSSVTDPWTGRTVKSAVQISRGSESVIVQRRTCLALVELGLLEGWTDTRPRTTRRSRKPAGVVTMEDIALGRQSDPEIADQAVVEALAEPEIEVVPDEAERAVDALDIDDLLEEDLAAEDTVEEVEEIEEAPSVDDDVDDFLSDIFS